jgi:hypothetical protein
MDTVRHKLMIHESEKRFEAAAALRASGEDSDSAYLLRLLGFELLLKVVVEQSTSSAAHGHKYAELFSSLPANVQSDLLRLAGERIGPSGLTASHLAVLNDLGSNFVGLRYPYEKYGHMTEQEYEQVGQDWINAGANNADAEFRYHPEELLGLIVALKQVANAG